MFLYFFNFYLPNLPCFLPLYFFLVILSQLFPIFFIPYYRASVCSTLHSFITSGTSLSSSIPIEYYLSIHYPYPHFSFPYPFLPLGALFRVLSTTSVTHRTIYVFWNNMAGTRESMQMPLRRNSTGFLLVLPPFALLLSLLRSWSLRATLFRIPLLCCCPEVRQFFNREINGCDERVATPRCNWDLKRNEFVERNEADALSFSNRCPCTLKLCLFAGISWSLRFPLFAHEPQMFAK